MTKNDPRTLKDHQHERVNEGVRVGIVDLGCARNTVDSQNILGTLARKGHHVVVPEQAEVVIVNTCSFIDDAKKESVDTILDLIEMKKQGKIKKVVVAGCLSQRYGSDLVKELPEVDAFVGVQALQKDKLQESAIGLTPQHFAYLKICESCYNKCSFCVIPKIKGEFVSRSIESVLKDAQGLDQRGVRELNIIGQDITAYGMDLYEDRKLAELLRQITQECHSIEWVRLLYAYPRHVTDELIEAIANEPKICKYIDMPLQHINDRILRAMHRGVTKASTLKLLKKIRERIEGVFLRTTFIVGFPGETEDEFEELCAFIQEYPFERLGVFLYSHEEGTEAYGLPAQVPEDVKYARYERLMEFQREISLRYQQRMLGQTLRVLIEEEKGDLAYEGRSEFDAPDIDGAVLVQSKRPLKKGEFVDVQITEATEYDLQGEAL